MSQHRYHSKLGVLLGSTWVLLSAEITVPHSVGLGQSLNLKHSWVLVNSCQYDGPTVQKDLQVWKLGREYSLFDGLLRFRGLVTC